MNLERALAWLVILVIVAFVIWFLVNLVHGAR